MQGEYISIETLRIWQEQEKENIELQERIKKAIEYINKFWKKKSYYEDVDNCMKYAVINEWEKEDLLNILNGENNERRI